MKYFSLILISILIQFYHCFEASMEATNQVVHDVPHILTGNINVTTFIGDTVILPCEVAHLGNYHVNWLKIHNNIPITLTVGYQQFSRNMRYRVTRLHDPNKKNKIESWNFEIRKVTPEDSGVFECYIKLNPKHKIKANVNLIVKNEKERTKSDISLFSSNYISDHNPRSERLSSNSVEKIDMAPNSWIKLRCNATDLLTLSRDSQTGRSSNDLQWYKDGKLIEQDSRRLKKWVSSYDNSNYMELELYAVDPEDSGVYQCKRDKTVLKNVVLQVVDSKGTRLSLPFDKQVLTLVHLVIGMIITKLALFN